MLQLISTAQADISPEIPLEFYEANIKHVSTTEEAQEMEPQDSGDSVRVPLTKTEFGLVYTALLLSIFLASLDQTIVATALKAITLDFGNQELVPWIGSAYLLTAAPFGTLYGKLADIFGRKWVFVFAITVFELGSLLCAVATSMPFLIIGRAVAGVGGGGIFSMVMIIVSDIVSIRDRGKYQGLIGAVFGLSSALAPLLGGTFSEYVTWRWCFFINLPLGAVTLMIVIFCLNFLSEKGSMMDKLARVDFLGAAVLFAAIICLITPLQLGGSIWAWDAPGTIVMFACCPFLFALFTYVECKISKEPIIPPSLFVNVSVPALLIIALALGAVQLAGVYYISLFFQVVYGSSATQAGLKIIPIVLGVMTLSISSGLLVTHFGTYKHFFFIGPSLMITGIALVSHLTGSSSVAQQYVFLAIFGFGIGCMTQLRIIALQASIPVELIAVGTAVSQTSYSLGSAIGIAITGTVFNNVAATNTASDSVLQCMILQFNKEGIAASTGEVLSLLELLNSLPTNTSVAQATEELVMGFNGAFKTAYLCLLPYALIILGCAFFVKQFKLGKAVKEVIEDGEDFVV
ncbi:hypothetical protein HDU98_000085 [Podochytrium sp. JEL0797]|nr:hypothetical protein HDU98_000085 [Podochytrium sp. JEL0797]